MTFNKSGLPAIGSLTKLGAALRNLEREAPQLGVTILKMDKTGHWVFGADQVEVAAKSLWAINPLSFMHGAIAWGDARTVLGEVMVPVTEDIPDLGPAPAGSKKGWEPQSGFSVKCMSGDDKGMEARYSVTSVGGRRAVLELGKKIHDQVGDDEVEGIDPEHPVPVVELDSEFYNHKEYGRIYTPIFRVVKWVGMGGEENIVEAVIEEPEAPADDRRRRRRG